MLEDYEVQSGYENKIKAFNKLCTEVGFKTKNLKLKTKDELKIEIKNEFNKNIESVCNGINTNISNYEILKRAEKLIKDLKTRRDFKNKGKKTSKIAWALFLKDSDLSLSYLYVNHLTLNGNLEKDKFTPGPLLKILYSLNNIHTKKKNFR